MIVQQLAKDAESKIAIFSPSNPTDWHTNAAFFSVV